MAGYVLKSDAEQALVARVTDVLVEHELRRIVDLIDDSQHVPGMTERARSPAWTFLHRTDTWVAGIPAGPAARGPIYKS
ncbi:hypothetical protein [Amycolatopsis sp. NPDC051061]|uniref:hypothetical protein n=1 Tax=Amycolatopsis sp. NPDC051061 TaxID=3155042 RepID=UPI00341EC084